MAIAQSESWSGAGGDVDEPVASIIIPAHNEEAVIGRLLSALPTTVRGRKLQVIVACNGCTDSTPDIARSFGATVVEVETASKVAALNAGDLLAKAFPRLYVDADIELTSRTVEDLVAALSDPEVLCAAPPSMTVLTGRPWLVKMYVEFWKHLMLEREGYVGAGVYAMSRAGRARFTEFPDLIADDTFVRNLFSRHERKTVATDPTIVQAPRTTKALLRRRIRVCIGNMELASRDPVHASPGRSEGRTPWWRIALSRPALMRQALVYAIFNGVAKISAARQLRSRRPIGWGRDDSTRSASA
jgi:glycosyltransferase involved in cell wall biosynthesis